MALTLYLSPISLIVQYLNNLGIMAAGGQLFTYVGGSVNTPLQTYTDSTGAVLNANPMTLSSTGRPVAASGAPVAFWIPAGSVLKLVVNDAGGNQLVSLDNIASINDLTNANNALQTLLASAANANAAQVGPVGGVDFVANGMKCYDIVADIRAANVPVLASGQVLSCYLQGTTAVNDGGGGIYDWVPSSAAADDGETVIKPTNVTGNGRWLKRLADYVVVEKNADQQVASSTALVNDNQLTMTLPVGTWWVQARLNLLGIGGTGQGYKITPFFAGTAPGVTAGGGINTSNAVAAALAAALNVNFTSAAISSTVGDVVIMDFVITVTAAGLFTIQFAQNSSSVNATVMKAGSFLLRRRVA